MKTIRRTLLAGAIAATLLATAITAQESSFEEIVVDFEVPKLLRQDIFVQYDGLTVYLPLLDLFHFLDIKIESDFSKKTFSGRWIGTGEKFAVDLTALRATVGNKEFPLDKRQFVTSSTELFLRIDLYETLFGLKMNFDFSSLGIRLPLNKDFPVYQKLLREKARKKLRQEQRAPQDIIAVDRRRDYLKGGVADWAITASPVGGGGHNFNLNAGGMVLGGDLSLSGGGNTKTGFDPGDVDYRWHYCFSDNKYVRQGELGKLYTGGGLSRSLTGFRLTNQPVVQRKFFQTVTINGNIGTGWEVELYVNGELADFVYTDEKGDYNFLVDAQYGSTRVMIKMYGPNGEIRTEDKYIRAPFNLIPHKTVEYSVAAGVAESPQSASRKYAQATTSYGLLKTMTLGLSADIPVGVPDGEKPAYLAEATYQLRGDIILSGGFAPGYKTELNFNYSKPSTLNFAAGYSKFHDDPFRNKLGKLSQVMFSASSPLRLFGRNWGLRYHVTFDKYPNFKAINMNYGWSASISRFSLNYIGAYKSSDYGQVAYKSLSSRLLLSARLFSWLRPQFRFDYEHYEHRAAGWAVYLAKRILRTGQVTFSYEHNSLSRINTASLNVSFFTGFAQFNTRLVVAQNHLGINQTQTGSVRYDQGEHQFRFERRPGVGYSSALVRPYLDHNYNGVFDGNDEYFPGIKAKIKGGWVRPYGREKSYYYDGLRPYDEYLVEIDEYSIDNPTLVPMHEGYKVNLNPNVVTAIDVPLVTAAEITGKVDRMIAQTRSGLGGIKVHLVNISRDIETQVMTFNSGEYYYLGLLPGSYRAYIDAEQLTRYGYRAEPESIEFRVEAVEGGASVENISFLLLPKDDPTK